MIKALKPLLLFFILCCAATPVWAQHSFDLSNVPALKKYQDSLISISEAMYNAGNNQDRFAANATFIKTLVNALKTQASFNFPFDSLKKVTVLKSPDNALRLISWYVPNDDGTYRFFGTIQMATKDGKLKMFPLIDGTDKIKDVNQVTDNKNWYGARYYQIVPVKINGQQPYYVLIGWKGNNAKTSKKVIEILSFDRAGQPVFGKTVFDGVKGSSQKNRVVFEYNKLNSMTLTMDRSVNMIVFDHLAPFTPDLEGNFEFYASDLSFDAYRVAGGRLKLVENVEMKNEPNAMDDFYADPKDKSTKAPKKL
ncbi:MULTISPECIES: hypothetical protein [Pedobacter]|uniref:Uncharacterized protein n=1 Tax=Pedobacter heparinus (strain ATCC 13125 / DSM 2366 / CIP 104194 / JCM 7457 / NBRC 12017 / NCIMB 9290 / NRRL B-14731 / HIM 762-3) TaxID=485917 RepID=C6Y1V8_PEDHD|nr:MULTISPECIES: hypothetical protein [Pedobacter]ACU05100.1 hypothetical protein Phep_2902 [Pedobacter heparinus DSM 2366]MBB5439379.1 hypothetical protein [Pedobacter sp. AK017]